MAIEKHTTSALVIASFDQGEHDRVYKLFTRDFGLVLAHGKSVRKLESKLRAHLKIDTYVRVTLVRGREVWRIVGVEETPHGGVMMHDIAALIDRFIRGEGAHKALFDRLLAYSSVCETFDERKRMLLLYYIMLVELGYADAQVIGARDVKEYVAWSVEDLYTHLLLSYETVRAHIHSVLKEIQL